MSDDPDPRIDRAIVQIQRFLAAEILPLEPRLLAEGFPPLLPVLAERAGLRFGEADAQAADIYAQAYNADPDFYAFTKSMETLKATIDEDTVLMLGTDGEVFKYLQDERP